MKRTRSSRRAFGATAAILLIVGGALAPTTRAAAAPPNSTANASIQATTSSTRDVVVTADALFWTNTWSNTIGRADYNGGVVSNVNQSFISGSGLNTPSGLAIQGSFIYWTNTGTNAIGRANLLDGTGATSTFIAGAANIPIGITADANYLYWANYGGNTIGRSDLGGTASNGSFIATSPGPFDVAVDGSNILWTHESNDLGTTVGRSDLAGNGVNNSFLSGLQAPAGLTVDANYIYVANYANTNVAGSGTVSRTKLDGTGTIAGYLSGLSSPVGVAVNGTHLFWTSVVAANTVASAVGRATLDNTAPVLSGLSNQRIKATSSSGAVATYAPTASDVDDSSGLTVSCVPASGATFPVSSTVVTCTASDPVGNASSGTFTVSVDATAPVLSLPANLIVSATSASGAAVTYATPVSATDADDATNTLNVSCAPGTVAGGTFPIGVTTVSCTASDVAGNTTSGSFTVTVNTAEPTIVRLAAGATLTKTVLGRSGVPSSGVAAVVLNVTAVNPGGDGYLTVFPCGALPNASNLNYRTGQTVPNLVVAPVSADGKICVYTFAATDLVIDVSGWFATAATGFKPLTPNRLLDTRSGVGAPAAKTTNVTLNVLGVGGVPSSGVAAVSLNVTAVTPVGDGYATVYPCGAVPNASNLNFQAGRVVANAVIAPVSASGTVCLTSTSSTDLIADVNGWFPTGGVAFAPIGPTRLFDTRSGIGGVPVGQVTPSLGLSFQVTGVGGVPSSGVTAVSLNVTVTRPGGDGFVTVYPCGTVPNASNLNFVVGQDVPNAVIVPVSGTGRVCFATSTNTDLIADVNGWMPTSASGFQGLTPTRIVDSR